MKNISLISALILMFLMTHSAYTSDNYVFAPFVSRLKAVENDSSIKLSWKDSRDIKGSCLIYRHTEKISRNNFSDAFLVAEIPLETENYTDTAMAETDFYYSVLVKNETGNIYDIFIPYRNVTSNPVSISNIKKIDDNITHISYLRVSEKKDSLYLTFRSSNPERNAAVLRSSRPIFTVEDIKTAALLSIIPSLKGSYTDFPIAGIPFYYCVVDAQLLKSYNITIIPFENSTISPSEIKISDNSIAAFQKAVYLRPEPLPAIFIDRDVITGRKISSGYNNFFPEKDIKPVTEKIILSIIKENPLAESVMESEILNPDDYYNQKENIQLSVLIERYFFKNEWAELKKKLMDFIRTSDRKSLKDRGSFYLGQCYYFTGEYNRAYLEFLASSDSFYPESKKWMNNILQTEY
jgi:hypothetical protein